MNNPDTEKKDEPIKITREEADKLNDFAQKLDDKVTHVVDYGSLNNEEKKKKR